jgi:hypothetical protein
MKQPSQHKAKPEASLRSTAAFTQHIARQYPETKHHMNQQLRC